MKYGTLLSGVLNAILAVVICVFSVIIFIQGLADLQVEEIAATFGLSFVLLILFFVLAIICGLGLGIFAICEFVFGFKTESDFCKTKNAVIIFCIIEGIFAILLLVFAFLNLLNMTLLFSLVASGIFISLGLKIMDLCILDKKVQAGLVEIHNKYTPDYSTHPTLQEQELQKIQELRSKGVLTAEEYENVKNRIIKN
ncbi:MAG: hypothetical protein J6C13_02275 [Clostridia bacterium]|nr:hypothetical protein [Clostridia bacterium]